jgi:non-specific serine/threonine protein kinase
VLQGDREVATPLLEECAELAPYLEEVATPIAEELAGWHDMFGGELTTAAEHFRSAAEGFAAAEWRGPQAEALMLLGMALDFAGDLEHAAEAHAACLQICDGGASPSIRAYSLQWGGLVAAKQGDHDRGCAWEREALRLSRDLEERVGVVLCLESLAWIECDTAPRRAATMFGAATAYLKSVGIPAQALPGLAAYHRDTEARLEATLTPRELTAALERGSSMQLDAAIAFALDESQPTAPASEAATGDPTAKLTRREREIAGLVAEGLSNREIATRLVISVRTVETHVEHALVKLGFTSRAQIAAWLSKQAGA